jgi:hypothetical protein
MKKDEVENFFGFTYAANPADALQQAFALKGKDAKVLVVPQGTTTFITVKGN